ncbi:MAG TPA: YHYH protein [Acidimicrobiales bacterium]
MKTGFLAVGLAAGGVLAACGGGQPASTSASSTSAPARATTSTTTSPGASGSGVTRWPGTPIADTAIPLGDGKLSTTPQIGDVDSCQTQFSSVGGAQADGPWINTSAATWNATTKIHVQGATTWPNASHSFIVSGPQRVLVTNDLPTGATTGTFPIASSDPAYQYDRNPNSVTAQSYRWSVPADPTAAETPSCIGQGPIGISVDGVVFFNALDDEGRDAGAHELQDSCDGHPQMQGVYHYHTYSPCLATAASNAAGSSTLVGYALDGYGIYLERDAQGNLPTDADLDACHGRTSAVRWDGRRVVMYHYDITEEYPYTVGCYHATPVSAGAGAGPP